MGTDDLVMHSHKIHYGSIIQVHSFLNYSHLDKFMKLAGHNTMKD